MFGEKCMCLKSGNQNLAFTVQKGTDPVQPVDEVHLRLSPPLKSAHVMPEDLPNHAVAY